MEAKISFASLKIDDWLIKQCKTLGISLQMYLFTKMLF